MPISVQGKGRNGHVTAWRALRGGCIALRFAAAVHVRCVSQKASLNSSVPARQPFRQGSRARGFGQHVCRRAGYRRKRALSSALAASPLFVAHRSTAHIPAAAAVERAAGVPSHARRQPRWRTSVRRGRGEGGPMRLAGWAQGNDASGVAGRRAALQPRPACSTTALGELRLFTSHLQAEAEWPCMSMAPQRRRRAAVLVLRRCTLAVRLPAPLRGCALAAVKGPSAGKHGRAAPEQCARRHSPTASSQPEAPRWRCFPALCLWLRHCRRGGSTGREQQSEGWAEGTPAGTLRMPAQRHRG
jgi:hypothetical protein